MAKDPAFLFYSSDFLNGVSDLTMEERGQFITLLCLQHQKDGLNEKTIRLSVGSVSVDVMDKFRLSDGKYFNNRLCEEIEKRKNYTASRRENGLKGGRPKAKDNLMDKHMVNHMEDENENDNENINANKNELLIPKFLQTFKNSNPNYPDDKDRDYKALGNITRFLAAKENIKHLQPDEQISVLIPLWERISNHVANDNHFKNYSLKQIDTYIQTIINSIQNGTNNKPNSKITANGLREAHARCFGE